MCVALKDATFGTTTIAGWRRVVGGRRVHAMVYGNEPFGRFDGPNAIALPFPIAPGTSFGPANFLPTDGLSHLLDDMWAAVPEPELERMTMSRAPIGKGGPEVSVFQRGIYTWVSASQIEPELIMAALELVNPAVRPDMPEWALQFYQQVYPGWALAIGCFPHARGQKAEPVAVQYEPRDWELLHMPAIDAHGETPKMGRNVTVNHRIIVGTEEFGYGGRVLYNEQHRFDPALAAVLPRRVAGAELREVPMLNGDFYVRYGRDGEQPRLLRTTGIDLTADAYEIPLRAA
jgi:hypothetical protein